MIRILLTCTCCLTVSFTPALGQKYGGSNKKKVKKLEDYLTEDGKLKAAIEVRDEKRGFGIFFGTHWRIEPDGSWTSTRIYLNKPHLRGRGKLTKKDLKKLAKVFVKNDPSTLPSRGRPLLNPHVLSVSYGSRSAVLIFGVDQRARPNGGVVGRFGGIKSAVSGLIEPHIGPEPPLPRRLR